MKELAQLFKQYMMEDDRFARSVFDDTTQIGRSLVREEALPEDNYSEVQDWERASHIIKSADAVGVAGIRLPTLEKHVINPRKHELHSITLPKCW